MLPPVKRTGEICDATNGKNAQDQKYQVESGICLSEVKECQQGVLGSDEEECVCDEEER